MASRKSFGLTGDPAWSPAMRFKHLGAFWPHWNLHRRACSATGQPVVSTFSDNCPYPVWKHSYWLENANPPSIDPSLTEAVFPQLWKLFQNCPIQHNLGAGNENCEYTEDWWYSRNCYLCHSGVSCEDLKYCYRVLNINQSQFCSFIFDSEFCVDCVNCFNCFEFIHSFNCKNCQQSAFLYDCRNCSDCLFCTNLRHKHYCIENRQLSKADYLVEKQKWDLRSRRVYETSRKQFLKMLLTSAWHRSLRIDNCENCIGDYLERNKNCHNTFFTSESEDCVNAVRNHQSRNILDVISCYKAELAHNCTLVQDNSYQATHSLSLTNCQFMDYCAYCLNCKHCFGCCGLVGKEYHLFNKEYSRDQYQALKAALVSHMQETGESDTFFPGHFAPNPYSESLASMYFPLDESEVETQGYRKSETRTCQGKNLTSVEEIPDRSDAATGQLSRQVFWDSVAKRPFRIQDDDIEFSARIGVPLANCSYARRIQDNFSLIPFSGHLRKTVCAKSDQEISTTWPEKYDGRILSEAEYTKLV